MENIILSFNGAANYKLSSAVSVLFLESIRLLNLAQLKLSTKVRFALLLKKEVNFLSLARRLGAMLDDKPFGFGGSQSTGTAKTATPSPLRVYARLLKIEFNWIGKSLPLLIGIFDLITPSSLENSILKLKIVEADVEDE